MTGLAWRLWPTVRLTDPYREFGFGPVNHIPGTADFNAHCPHGTRPPTPACPCGLHWIADTNREQFFHGRQVREGHRNHRHRIVASVGEPIGAHLLDHNTDEHRGWNDAPCWRSTGFRIHGLIVAPNQNNPAVLA